MEQQLTDQEAPWVNVTHSSKIYNIAITFTEEGIKNGKLIIIVIILEGLYRRRCRIRHIVGEELFEGKL